MDDLGNEADLNAPTSAPNYDVDAAYNEDAQYIADNGGPGNPYVLNQSPQDMADTGTATGNANGSATTTPPSWLSQILTSAQTTAQTIQTTAPLINGKPGQITAPATVPAATSSSSLIIILILAVVAFFAFGKKRRA